MTDTHRPTPASLSSAPVRKGKWLYPLLLTLETIGAVLLYSEGLPIYRETLANPANFLPNTTAVALGSTVLIQAAYWVGYRVRPAMPRYANPLLAHIVLFLARLAFLLPTAIFSYLFIAKTAAVEVPVTRYAFLILALFSLFCYVQELERLGARLKTRRDD